MNIEETLARAEIRKDRKEFDEALNLYDEILRKLFIGNESYAQESYVKTIEGIGRVFEIQGKWLAALSEFWIAASYLRISNNKGLLLNLFSEILSCIHKARKENIDISSNLCSPIIISH